MASAEPRPGPLARAAADLAAQAGAVILRVRDEGCVARSKADGSPVSEADEAADSLIRAGLAALTPDVAILSEECADQPPEDACRRDVWLVDPLDGTRDWLEGSSEFTVNLARVTRGVVVMAALGAPALGRIFVADAGRAWEAPTRDGAVDWSRLRPIRTRPTPEDGPELLVSRSNRDAQSDAWAERFAPARRRIVSSSLKFALIAAGEADAALRATSLHEWDLAAGVGLLTCAGGVVLDRDGQPLRFGDAARAFRTSPFAALGDPALAARARAAA